jgi:hypothetical protein
MIQAVHMNPVIINKHHKPSASMFKLIFFNLIYSYQNGEF